MIFEPFRYHWYFKDWALVATTVKVTELPLVTVWFGGWEVITGRALATVSVAPALVAEPAEFVATTVYVPALALVTLAIVYVADVAPLIAVPFFRHW